MNNSVILYYKYAELPYAESERASQRALCERLGLKGRILLAAEGINGTLSGTREAVDEYIATMRAHPQFFDMAFKRDETANIPFPRLRVKVRPEIVTLGAPVDIRQTATKLTPAQFHDLIKDPNVVLFDARNNYESAIGKFQGALTPDIALFKNFPETLKQYSDLKDKTIVTYCTGGIRCEKASALMKQSGFKDVYQLEGGIIEYAKAYPDGAFEGECFVFDERMSVAFNDHPAQIGSCHFCARPTNAYQNCADVTCNTMILVCTDCQPSHQLCSNTCRTQHLVPASN